MTKRSKNAIRRREHTSEVALPVLPSRARDAHKGDFGRVLVIAGSAGMPGAALLSALGALRGGAGLVTLATVKEIVPWIVCAAPSAMFVGLPATRRGGLSTRSLDELRERASGCDVLAIGPGLGRHRETATVIRAMVAESRIRVVLDADGLNAFEGRPELLAERSCPLVLTPHPGEFARLDGPPTPRDGDERRSRAAEFARRTNSVVLLKGAKTVITDGSRFRMNTTGNPGMASGGSGDVLTGIIAALSARMVPFDAASLGAHVHGLAGDLAAREGSETSLIATDLLSALPRAFRTVERR